MDGSNRFRAGGLVQEILSFQFRACNFVHGKFRAQEISCMNRNIVQGNYVQEILCMWKGNFVQRTYFPRNYVQSEKSCAWKFRACNFVHRRFRPTGKPTNFKKFKKLTQT